MKIKIIDLLNKIANDEEAPKTIKYEYSIYELTPERSNYYCKDEMRWFTNEINSLGALNNEVEIIEEDMMKKINTRYFDDGWYTPEERINVCMNYINKLINEINKLKEYKDRQYKSELLEILKGNDNNERQLERIEASE